MISTYKGGLYFKKFWIVNFVLYLKAPHISIITIYINNSELWIGPNESTEFPVAFPIIAKNVIHWINTNHAQTNPYMH